MKKPLNLNYENVGVLFPLGVILIMSVILNIGYQTYKLFEGDVEIIDRPYSLGELEY